MRILPNFTRLPEQPDAVLREQYSSLRQQIPLMYLLMLINAGFLAVSARHDVAFAMSVGVPFALCVMAAIRALAWLARRREEASLQDMRRHLRVTLVMAAFLSLLFGGWGLLLFDEVDPSRSSSIALYVFVGAIGCCYCLQALPMAARFVLLFGAAPVTVRLLISQDWYLFGIGLTFLLIAAVILRTLAANQSAFSEVMRSKAEMSTLLAALQQSQEHYRYSVDLNPQIPWIGDPDGAMVELSPRWAAVTGIPIEEGLGSGWIAAIHPDDLPGVMEVWGAAVDSVNLSAVDARYRLRQADNSYRWFRARAYPRFDADGRVLRWYGNLENIDEQVSAELALRLSEERYRLAARATSDFIFDWSPAAGRIEWAQQANIVFGHVVLPEGTSSEWWRAHVHPADLAHVGRSYQSAMRGETEGWSHEYRFKAGDGTYINLSSRAYAVRDEDGNITRCIGALLDITQAKRAEEELRWAANHDPLTDLPNRKMFAEKLDDALADASAASSCVGVVVIDIDGFKSINDNLGHAAGDVVLQAVGTRILANLPAGSTLARLGGDEFAVILRNLTLDDARVETVARVLADVRRPLAIDESLVEVTVSAGAAMWPVDGADAEAVLKSADLALYAAKADGANTIRGFRPEMRDAVESRKIMLRDAKDVLRDDRIIPFYQPKVSLSSGRIVGFEALLRWHHHRRGLQPPQTIQAAFDDSALSVQLTDRMLDRVLADVSVWLDKGYGFGRVALNGSPADFRQDDFADRILKRLQTARLSPALFELEVTESVFLGQMADKVQRALRTLMAEGVTIALDDFGTGYASLTHLQQFPVHVIKIDRSFISRLDSADSVNLAIVHGVIDIARRMNIQTVAEGVETQAQADRLRELGCDIGQGYLFGRAVSATRVGSLLRAPPITAQSSRSVHPAA